MATTVAERTLICSATRSPTRWPGPRLATTRSQAFSRTQISVQPASITGVQEEFRFRNLSDDPGLGLAVDGIVGPKTRAAVTGFQRALGIGADGIVGPLTCRYAAGAWSERGPGRNGTWDSWTPFRCQFQTGLRPGSSARTLTRSLS